MDGPIGMSEEKDTATLAAEKAMFELGHHAGGVEDIVGVPPQMQQTLACRRVPAIVAAPTAS